MTRTIVPTGTLADIEKGIAMMDVAYREYLRAHDYGNLHELNYDPDKCINCLIPVPSYEGQRWEMVHKVTGARKIVTFCADCHGDMIEIDAEIDALDDLRDLKDTENCARPTL